MSYIFYIIICCIITLRVLALDPFPDISSGGRTQFYDLKEDGSYTYGYDTGVGLAVKQSADASNQVVGRYAYKTPVDVQIDLKYTAGVQGFVPERWPDVSETTTFNYPSSGNGFSEEPVETTTNFATDFKPTGGSLPQPNGLLISNINYQGSLSNQAAVPINSTDTSNNLAYGSLNPDGSYSFGFKTTDQARQESADASNNVQGSYSYQNSAGSHDLKYVAGAATGFKPTGGSLSQLNGLLNSNNNFQGSISNQAAAPSNPADVSNNLAYGSLNTDRSYSFGFKTNDQSRQESADASNNVQGSYSYQNSAGSHDLKYVAGAATGFKPTGGSLSQLNGLLNSNNNFQGSISNQAAAPSNPADVSNNLAYGSLNTDRSYSFGFKTNDQSRQESADASNNVQGSYSYQNSAGSHDLKYVAGAATGFKPTGGSLSQPNGLLNSNNNFQGSLSNQAAAASNPADVSNNLAYGSLNPDGSYSFGFKSNDQSRQESSDASNNVQGSYSYQNSAGSHDLSYIAGAATGFKPTGGSLSQPNGLSNSNSNFQGSISNQAAAASNPADVSNNLAYGSLNPDGSYSFGFKSNDQSRQESADASNNVQGSYYYQNSAGSHDLSYIAGAATGFKPTGGSLSQPNGLLNSNNNYQGSLSNQAAVPINSADTTNNLAYGSLNPDGSYSFGFKASDQARQESADATNNVQGSYSYQNSAGSHDLSYVAGAATGFKPTGGSLSQPNGLLNSNNNYQGSLSDQAAVPINSADTTNNLAYGSLNPDGSYSFGFKASDQARQESADSSNNVQGSYSYQNSAGSHDLKYVAGAATGFKPTGGSLSQPNGLLNSNNNFQGSLSNQAAAASNPADVSNNLAYGSLNPDGSYSFGFKSNDQSRQESADASNNVQGSYSYQNSAGSHDLSYIAGAATGFKPTGGSLSQPNGLSNSNSNFQGSISNQAAAASNPADVSNNLAYGSLNPDGSYSFGFKSNDQSRQESADASNNVQGSYYYQNSAGSHDLSYIAGAATGFKPTGGSLSQPNGLLNSNNNFQGSLSNQAAAPSNPADVSNNLAYGSLNPDGSYSFGFKTNDQARQESADASNNVQGSYSYQNSAGSHDLNYVAGAATGFKPTGGSLSQPNGLSNSNNNFQGSLSNQAAVPSNSEDTSNNLAYGSLNPDGFYSFGFKTSDQARQESADANNNVKGSYSYQNSAGSHDLSYVAGAATGFKPTGGSLSTPNGFQKTK